MNLSNYERSIYRRFIDNSHLNWGSKEIEDVYPFHPYLVENLENMKICSKCFSLYGTVKLRDGQTVQQKCQCGIASHDERWVVTAKSHTIKKDFNNEYEICYCCGMEIIPSGGRWNVFFCQFCHSNVMALNVEIGGCIIPIGRHSIMNGIFLSGRKAKDKKAIHNFVDSANSLNELIRTMFRYSKRSAQKQVKRFKMAKDEPAINLIHHSDKVVRKNLKIEAFIELVSFIMHKSIEDVQFFYWMYLSDKIDRYMDERRVIAVR